MSASQAVGMTADWLNGISQNTMTVSDNNTRLTVGNTVEYLGPFVAPYNQWWPSVTYGIVADTRPIKLTLQEVDALRKAAKADPKLKEILLKFTGQIEIKVEF